MSAYDAVVVGAGPNGLVAANLIAEAGGSVLVREANPAIGGAVRTLALTLPGFAHDAFSSTFPLTIGSPMLRGLALEAHGLRWVQPPAACAHPLDDGSAILLERSLEATADQLGADGARYRSLLAPFVERWDDFANGVLGPLRIPRHPVLMARFGVHGIRSITSLARTRFSGERARALLAGSAAHGGLPLGATATAAFGILLNAAGHAVGWPIVEGGAGALADALADRLRFLGGAIELSAPVTTLDELPPARAILLDLTPEQIVRIAGHRLPEGYCRRLRRYRYGPGVYKVDWALREPVPWRAPECARSATVHLGGSMAEIAHSEGEVTAGRHPEHPFVLFGQPSLFDPTRAPDGMHTAWAYCHVPNDSPIAMLERIERQVERFAPGFREVVMARHIFQPADLEREDANLVGGDINGGSARFDQFFFRPTARWNPYTTPVSGLFICSASTPPGGGVHGMCGAHAGRTALRHLGLSPRSARSQSSST